MFVLRRLGYDSLDVTNTATTATSDSLDASSAYSGATTYAKYDRVYSNNSDGWSMNWISTAASNTGHTPSSGDTYRDDNGELVLWWKPQFNRAGSRIHGLVAEVQSEALTDDIYVEWTLSNPATAVALINVDAESAQLIVDDSGGVEVYNQTVDLTSYSAITSSYDYFFTPALQITDYVFRDIPQYADAVYKLDITVTSGKAKCGPIILGPSVSLGKSLYGLDLGIKDFSRVVQESGISTIQEELQSRTMEVQVFVTKGNEEAVLAVMREQLNKPTVWQADETDGATLVYGYFTRARLLYETPAGSMYNISIQGIQR